MNVREPRKLIILTEGLDLSMGAALSLCTVVLAVVQMSTGSVALGFAASVRYTVRLLRSVQHEIDKL